MEVFNKFYSSVSNTVSQLSGVLPGNPVTREFEATQFIASAGPGKLRLLLVETIVSRVKDHTSIRPNKTSLYVHKSTVI